MNDLDAELEAAVRAVAPDVVAWRRHFHAHPELSYQEFETSRFIVERLAEFGGFDISRPTETSVMARLIGKPGGKTLAFRADIDALALTELNDFDFASKNPGKMHACGHDTHAAMLLGAAKALSKMKGRIDGEVRFIFQHAEEVPPGGAVQLVEAGVMEGVDAIVGLHIFGPVPAGTISFVPGAMTADGLNCSVKVKGKGGHSAMPEFSVDPVAIAAQIVVSLQHIVAREVGAFDNVVVSATRFNTPGEAFNVTPDYVDLGINARGVSADFREKIPAAIERIVKGVCGTYGASYDIDFVFSYPSVVNDASILEAMKAMATRIYGDGAVEIGKPTMGGEDFSGYLTAAPGCFIALGGGNPELGAIYPNHHPRFTVDESALSTGVGLFVHGAFELLKD